MKKYKDLPVYFIFIGMLLNILMYLYHPVAFSNLMIRTCIVVILFGVTGYYITVVLNDIHKQVLKNKRNNTVKEQQDTSSKIDIRVVPEEDELMEFKPTINEEFVEVNLDNFKKLMNND